MSHANLLVQGSSRSSRLIIRVPDDDCGRVRYFGFSSLFKIINEMSCCSLTAGGGTGNGALQSRHLDKFSLSFMFGNEKLLITAVLRKIVLPKCKSRGRQQGRKVLLVMVENSSNKYIDASPQSVPVC